MNKKTFVIGIAGGSGSGKTTLARNISSHFGEQVALLRHDDYYKDRRELTSAELDNVNYDHPSAFDTSLLTEHLKALIDGKGIDAPVYDYESHRRSNSVRHIEPATVILVEGILILESEELSSLFDLKIFVDTDADVRLIRRIRRDTKKRGRSLDSVIEQYLTTVKPMHDAFVEPSKRKADIIVPEGGKNPVAYHLIIDRIEHHLKGNPG